MVFFVIEVAQFLAVLSNLNFDLSIMFAWHFQSHKLHIRINEVSKFDVLSFLSNCNLRKRKVCFNLVMGKNTGKIDEILGKLIENALIETDTQFGVLFF